MPAPWLIAMARCRSVRWAASARWSTWQALYIDPAAKVVIARFGSHPVAGNSANDPTTLPAFDALARYLMAQPTR